MGRDLLFAREFGKGYLQYNFDAAQALSDVFLAYHSGNAFTELLQFPVIARVV
jgi:hypothetical protein